MKIAILGGTPLAKSLGKKYLEAGIGVAFGVGHDFDTEEPEWKALNKFFHRLMPYESAIVQGEFILLCYENADFPEVWVALKHTDTDGKIIIDCSNGSFDTKHGFTNEQLIQKAVPNAKVFRAFYNFDVNFDGYIRAGEKREAFFQGENGNEKNRVKRLIEVIRFKAIDKGICVPRMVVNTPELNHEPEKILAESTKNRSISA